MFKYARTKEFNVSIQPGNNLSEVIPIKGARNVIVTRQNTTNSFCSSSSLNVYPYVSYNGITFRNIIVNIGNGKSTTAQQYFGLDQNNDLTDYDFTFSCSGFNYLKILNAKATCTATALFKVMVVS